MHFSTKSKREVETGVHTLGGIVIKICSTETKSTEPCQLKNSGILCSQSLDLPGTWWELSAQPDVKASAGENSQNTCLCTSMASGGSLSLQPSSCEMRP